MKTFKQHVFILAFLAISFTINSQEYSHEFGNVTNDELELKEYKQDKKAEAIIIYDIGKSKFVFVSSTFEVAFTRRKKIKIFSEAGLDQGEIEIYYYRNDQIWEKIEDLEAYTYNLENGLVNKIALDPEQVFDEKVNDRWYVKKFAMPDVRPGSIIEYQYKLTTQANFNLPDWYYQSTIPTLYSEYEVHMIPFYEYVYLLQGASKFDYQSSEEKPGMDRVVGPVHWRDMIHKYVMKDIPAFRDEEFITSPEDYLVKIDFQKSAHTDIYGRRTEIISTWPKLSNTLIKHPEFGKYISSSSKVSNKYFDYSSIAGKSDEEKFNSILDFIKENFNWNNHSSIFADKSASKFGIEKEGLSSEINLFMCGMLQEAGMIAKPVLISTRDHGKIRIDYPFIHYFNDVIVLVDIDGKSVLADATDSYCPNYLIPIRCLNDQGLVIEKNSERWVELTSDKQSVIRHSFKTNFTENADSMNIEFKINTSNYEAINLRKKYRKDYGNLEEYITKRNFTLIDSIKIENYYDKEEPFKFSTQVSYRTEKIADKLYIAPFFEFPAAINPFKESGRTYPIDMTYPYTYLFVSQIKLPEGYKIEQKPIDVSMKGKLVETDYKVSQNSENEILVMGSYKFNKAVYAAEDYGKLKFYYNQIVKKFNEKFVLVKEE